MTEYLGNTFCATLCGCRVFMAYGAYEIKRIAKAFKWLKIFSWLKLSFSLLVSFDRTFYPYNLLDLLDYADFGNQASTKSIRIKFCFRNNTPCLNKNSQNCFVITLSNCYQFYLFLAWRWPREYNYVRCIHISPRLIYVNTLLCEA